MFNNFSETPADEIVFIPEENSVQSIKTKYSLGKLPMKTYLERRYNITEKGLNQTTVYLFYVEAEMYYDKFMLDALYLLQRGNSATPKFSLPQIYLEDENKEDYSHEDVIKNKDKPYLYHVMIDMACPNFEKAIALMRKSPFYVNDYFHIDLTTEKVVVQIIAISKNRINLFNEGKFSQLFSENDYSPLTVKPYTLLTYFNTNLVTGKYYFNDFSAVLVGLKKEKRPACQADVIIEQLGIDDKSVIKLLYERHGFPQVDKIKKTI